MGCFDLSGIYAFIIGSISIVITFLTHFILFITFKFKNKEIKLFRFIYPAYIFVLLSYLGPRLIYRVPFGAIAMSCSGPEFSEYLSFVILYSILITGIIEIIFYLTNSKTKSKKINNSLIKKIKK